MEHRYHQRKSAHGEVELWRGDDLLGRFETRDVSLEGAFVKAEAKELETYDVVTVVVHDRRGGPLHRTLAMVVHQSQEGTGLLYEAEAPDLYRCLTRDLEAA
ncbi:MAG: PilZ domain-containing protein [Gammaproteobacteria bacterium]|nr:PilZ domain-containing protein [Gammaproteobacteria bacterium]NIR88940.1 PilZ domain-containing protein [Gammaproteobacteria bacterium]NIU05229.1 PilZ domain-containing protein [Gammaproteobacteria bacterium]NIV52844.1 hypothetical protein [Gammaproteobacteria bacterium]NIW85140.1 hypothetical protein [Gammaproteobacteria bacterium]